MIPLRKTASRAVNTGVLVAALQTFMAASGTSAPALVLCPVSLAAMAEQLFLLVIPSLQANLPFAWQSASAASSANCLLAQCAAALSQKL